jgi:hypothetical protein
VVDLDSTLGQQLLHIAVGQAVAQLPTHRHRDHLPREAVAGRRGRNIPRSDHRISLSRPTTIDQRNRPEHRIAALTPAREASADSS